jgi:hypothetical protein
MPDLKTLKSNATDAHETLVRRLSEIQDVHTLGLAADIAALVDAKVALAIAEMKAPPSKGDETWA